MFVLMLSLLFSLLVAMFALQNSTPVQINFFWTVQEVPLVIVILGSALAGAFITLLFALFREYRYRRKRKKEAGLAEGPVADSGTDDSGSKADPGDGIDPDEPTAEQAEPE